MEITPPELPDLRLSKRIGSGATAQVYEAYRQESGEKIALKVVSLQSLPDESARLRVKREAIALQTLRHPSIVRLFQFRESKENLFLELEFVDGGTLTEWQRKNSVLLIEPKLWILANLAQALAVAHMDGTIHRDLKPDNILISRDGDVKLTDFGLSKQSQLEPQVTLPGVLVGSLAYMAPELLNEGKASFASDIFSFGVIAYELLTGRHPFPHQDVRSLLEGLYGKNQELSFRCSPALPSSLEVILLQCLHSDPEKRPSSLWKIYAELMVCLDASGIREFCRALVGTNAAAGGALTKALGIKHSVLTAEIEEESKKKDLDRKKLVRWINEFAILFPDDKRTTKYLSLLRENTSPLVKALLVAIALGVSIGLYPVAKRTLLKKAEAVPSAQPQVQAPAPVAAAKPEADEPREEPPPKARRPKRKLVLEPKQVLGAGVLDLVVPEDVKVFIDGQEHGHSELRGLKLPEGPHHVLMEMEGYLPIEKTIQIKKGSITKIRAGGEQ